MTNIMKMESLFKLGMQASQCKFPGAIDKHADVKRIQLYI